LKKVLTTIFLLLKWICALSLSSFYTRLDVHY
jgi:hypothetical protein